MMQLNLNHLMQYQSQSMAKFKMQKQLQGLLGISAVSNGGSITIEASHAKAPWSPTSTTYQKWVIRTDGGTQIPTLQLPKSPEPPICARNEVQNMMQSELTFSTDF